ATPRCGCRPRGNTERAKQDIMPHVLLKVSVGALLCAVSLVSGANADTVEDFYEGKTITIVTSTGVGGPFDLTARALAKHMPKYLPGRPTMIVRNMPGGGNVLATNYMYTQ